MKPDTYDSLDGQVALVTGANRGIGQAIADQLVAEGATVYASARSAASVTVEGRRPLSLDVTDESQIIRAVQRIIDREGRLDIVVNNAGICGPETGLPETPVQQFRRTLETNLEGPALIAKYAIPHLVDSGGGRIVNLTSEMGTFEGRMDNGGWPSYRISKAGLNALSLSLAGEYSADELLVNAVNPGKVATRMGGPDATRSPAQAADTPVWLAKFKPGGPSGYLWKDREIVSW